jgi:uncharacterized membrane protein SpoIIM required for sporulation
MKQELFQTRYAAQWDAFAHWLEQRSRPPGKSRGLDADGVFPDSEFPAAYRRLCEQLALAERRGYSAQLVRRLRDLVERGHLVFYRPRAPRLRRIVDFFAADFPRLVRAQRIVMLVSAALFFVPLIAVGVLLQYRPELVHSIFDPQQLAKFENMYDPNSSGQRLGREDGSDLMMFGYYILNNVGIGFRTFASGLLAGIGAVFMLIMNGVVIGGVAGHLTGIGYGDTFWRFVAGHSGPELMAIVISGGAGLQIGMTLLAPGRRSRRPPLGEPGVFCPNHEQ